MVSKTGIERLIKGIAPRETTRKSPRDRLDRNSKTEEVVGDEVDVVVEATRAKDRSTRLRTKLRVCKSLQRMSKVRCQSKRTMFQTLKSRFDLLRNLLTIPQSTWCRCY